MDKSVFYVSKTQNGNVEYDSEQLPSVGGTSGNVNSRDNVNLLISTALSYFDFNISEYTEYISGSCYDDDGHYIITVDYPGGEEQGVAVEAFVLKLDMISDGLTANSAKIEFRAQGVTVTGEFGIGDTEIQTFSDTEKLSTTARSSTIFRGRCRRLLRQVDRWRLRSANFRKVGICNGRKQERIRKIL